MKEQKVDEGPFLALDPIVCPALGLGQVSVLLCRVMGEWETNEAADPFALESQPVPSVARWGSPKAVANSSPTKTPKWEKISQT